MFLLFCIFVGVDTDFSICLSVRVLVVAMQWHSDGVGVSTDTDMLGQSNCSYTREINLFFINISRIIIHQTHQSWTQEKIKQHRDALATT